MIEDYKVNIIIGQPAFAGNDNGFAQGAHNAIFNYNGFMFGLVLSNSVIILIKQHAGAESHKQ